MKLQIKDAGAWRNVVTFTTAHQEDVMCAAAGLLKILNQPGTVMRIAEGDTPLFYCQAPGFLWSQT